MNLTPQGLLLKALPLTIGLEEVGGPNAGRGVERIQKTTGNKRGDAWCASFVYSVGSQLFGKSWLLPRTASCDALLQWARQHGALDMKPMPGDVFLLLKNENDAVHTGFVTSVSGDAFETVEGNTNPAGGREGYGVFARTRPIGPKYRFIRWTE